MVLRRIVSEAGKAEKEVAELCSSLIQFNSAHPEGRTVECVNFIKKYFDENGIESEIHAKTVEKPNIVAKIPGGSEHKILWVGHLDVVPEGKHEFWTHHPYSGKITDDGRIHGRGSSDMKGACAAAMVSARILNDLEKPKPNPVEFWFTADEEIGGGDGALWLSETGRFKGEVCVIGDGNGGGLEYPSIDLGCKGAARTTLVAKGKTAHGSTPFLGENAIERLIRAIPVVEKISDYRLELPEELSKPVAESVRFLMKTQEMTPEQKKAAKRAFNYPTVACNMISGGVKINVVPDYAEAQFDIRLTPGCKPLKVREQIEKLVREAGIPGVEVSVNAGETAGYYESPSSTFAQQLASAVKMVTRKKPRFKILTGGTDAISIKRYTGIPCLGYGTSLSGQAHQPNEYVTIENLILGVKVYSIFPLIYKA